MHSLVRTHFVKPPTLLSLPGASAHPELVEGRGNLVEVEHTSSNHHCYGDHC